MFLLRTLNSTRMQLQLAVSATSSITVRAFQPAFIPVYNPLNVKIPETNKSPEKSHHTPAAAGTDVVVSATNSLSTPANSVSAEVIC